MRINLKISIAVTEIGPEWYYVLSFLIRVVPPMVILVIYFFFLSLSLSRSLVHAHYIYAQMRTLSINESKYSTVHKQQCSRRVKQDFFANRVIKYWDLLPEEALHVGTVDTFKKYVDKLLNERNIW